MKNDPIFAAMKAQLAPSQGAREALLEALQAPIAPLEGETGAKTPEKTAKKPNVTRYLALAACAALVLCAGPVGRLLAAPDPRLHSYTLTKEPLPAVGSSRLELAPVGGEGDVEAGAITGRGEGDHDVAMSPGALREEMKGAGFSDADVDAYLSAGHHMTWALWHRYAGGADLAALTAYTRENQAQIDRIIADYGLDEEDGTNAGDLPGGAYIGEGAVQQGAEDYARLMEYFRNEYGDGAYPDWYGGSYVDDTGRLVVRVVTGAADDKNLLMKIQDWAGSREMAFTDGKYALTELRSLQKQVEDLLAEHRAEGWLCADNEVENRIDLDLSAADEGLLAALAQLDPDDDAICVRVWDGAAPRKQGLPATPAPGGVPVGVGSLPGEEEPLPAETEQPAVYDLLILPLDGEAEDLPAPVEDGETDPIAWEPQMPEEDREEQPQSKGPAVTSVSQTTGRAPAGE